MAVLPKLSQGMQTMKYALNHPWHFKTLWLTTSISGLQILVVIYFEIVKMYVFYRSANLWDLLINFSIMAVISNIDDFLYKTILEDGQKKFIKTGSNQNFACDNDNAAANSEIQNEQFIEEPEEEGKEPEEEGILNEEEQAERERLDQLWRENDKLEPMVFLPIQTTTSARARHDLDENRLTLQRVESPQAYGQREAKRGKQEIPERVQIKAKDRSLYNKFMFFCVYRVLRFVYVGIWFYFFSLLLLVFSYVIPWYHSRPPLTKDWIDNQC